MKKTIVWLFVLYICGSMLSACLPNRETTSNGFDDKLSVVVTSFPVYDWTREIIGSAGGIELSLLSKEGLDPHSFQPSVEDLTRMAESDMFIHVGGESDAWVHDALRNFADADIKVINLVGILGESVKNEEIVEGMEHDYDHDHTDEHEYEHAHTNDHDHETERLQTLDEHVWLSLRNAQIICRSIAETLSNLDSVNGGIYTQNCAEYLVKLDALDRQYDIAVNEARERTLVFGDRFPFRYLVDDYGLQYFAAFPGCSAETEASFETIVFLASKLDELELDSIVVIDGSNRKIADIILLSSANREREILELDSMQSVNAGAIASGYTYLGAMGKNLEVLKVALA